MRWRGDRRKLHLGVAALTVSMALGLGCAPKQLVPLEVAPGDVELYVDGERWPELPASLELRADRDHKLYFKKPGHQPELVVLRSASDDGETRLEPDTVRVELRSTARHGRRVQIEREGDEPAPDPADAAPDAPTEVEEFPSE